MIWIQDVSLQGWPQQRVRASNLADLATAQGNLRMNNECIWRNAELLMKHKQR